MIKSSGDHNIHYSNNSQLGLNPQWIFGLSVSSPDAAIWDSSNSAPDIAASATGRFIAGKVYNAVWNDIAESVPSDGTVKPYELAMVDVKSKAFQATKFDGENVDAILGIVSPDPGFIVGVNKDYCNPVEIALKGMVWVSVGDFIKDCRIGNRIMITNSGFAICNKFKLNFSFLWRKKLLKSRVLGTIINIDFDTKKVKIFI